MVQFSGDQRETPNVSVKMQHHNLSSLVDNKEVTDSSRKAYELLKELYQKSNKE